MSHTSQRRGLDPSRPSREIIVLAMVPSSHKDRQGISSAMAELGLKMLEHGPHNWLSRNFTEITVPDLGPTQKVVESLYRRSPDLTEKLLIRGVALLSTVITAIYTDQQKVVDLLDDLNGDWLANNRKKGYPISIVVSGLFDDVHKCCKQTGLTEHTYLHSLGFQGRADMLPGEKELEVVTMCGHGLIAASRVSDLVDKINNKEMTVSEAARDVAKPCVCGIVNIERAEEVFTVLANE